MENFQENEQIVENNETVQNNQIVVNNDGIKSSGKRTKIVLISVLAVIVLGGLLYTARLDILGAVSPKMLTAVLAKSTLDELKEEEK